MSTLFSSVRPLRAYPEPEPVATAFADVGHPYATTVPFPRNCRFKAVIEHHYDRLVVHCLYVTTRGRKFYASSDMSTYEAVNRGTLDAQMALTREAFGKVEKAVRQHNLDTLPIRN